MPKNSEALAALKAQLDRSGLGTFLEQIRTPVLLLDRRGAPVGWNPAFDSTHDPRRDFLEPSAKAGFEQALEAAGEAGEPVRFQLMLPAPGGRAVHYCSLIPVEDGRFLLIAEPAAPHVDADRKELEKVKSELQEARQALDVKQKELHAVLAQTDEVVHTDALTLLPNRRWIIADLQRQVTYSERYGSPLSVSMVDLDNFKEINDTYGHGSGDQVLRFIASEMRDRIRQPDEIGRYGGDEFLVILPNTTVNAAAEQANRLCQHVRGMPVIAGKDVIRTTLSIGIAQYRQGGDDWQSLLDRADQACYQAKHNGRDQWAILNA